MKIKGNSQLIIFEIILLLILITFNSRAQEHNKLDSQLLFESNSDLKLPNQIPNPSQELVSEIIKKSPDLNKYNNTNHYYYSVLKNSTYYTDLDNDGDIDMVLYIKGFWNGDGIEIFINENDIYRKVYSCPVFEIVKSFFSTPPNSVFYLATKNYYHSSFPFLASYDELTIAKNEIIKSKTYFYEVTQFPEEINLNIKFRILNDKYRLRRSPHIDNEVDSSYESTEPFGNIILELAENDTGTALAEYTDQTGRIWWFVKMDNNIKKPLDNYFYYNKSGERYRIKEGLEQTLDHPIFGWLSSRYVERIK